VGSKRGIAAHEIIHRLTDTRVPHGDDLCRMMKPIGGERERVQGNPKKGYIELSVASGICLKQANR
jgi:hypothetical protein